MMIDLARGVPEDLTLDLNAHALVWLPDGQRLAFSSNRGGPANIFVRDPRGSGPSDPIVAGRQHADPGSWSRDGRWLAYTEVSPLTSWDLWTYDATTRRARTFLQTEAAERSPAISPNGRWIAYCSNSEGHDEVYAEAFPSGGRREKISADGGSEPLWSYDGREIFYRKDSTLMRVAIEGSAELSPGRPTPLFDVSAYAPAWTLGPVSYAVSHDARSFYFVKPIPIPPEPTRIHVILGWLDEFTRSIER
jgi:Tol biopolymer transport system component